MLSLNSTRWTIVTVNREKIHLKEEFSRPIFIGYTAREIERDMDSAGKRIEVNQMELPEIVHHHSSRMDLDEDRFIDILDRSAMG